MAADLKMFANSVKARDRLTKAQLITIRNLYKSWANEVGEIAESYKNKRTSSGILMAVYYRQLQSQLTKSSKLLSNEVYKNVRKGMVLVSDAVVRDAIDWTSSAGFDRLLLSRAYSNIPDSVVRNLVTGRVYESGWSLSKSIWGDNEKTLKDIYTIIAEGRAKQEGVYETAKKIEQYVNPDKVLPWSGPAVTLPDGSKQTMHIYKRKIDYNAQRLVRTLNQHTYQQSVVQTTKDNPFVEKFRWEANGSRACPLCIDRDGKEFSKEDLPLDHPNGMCVMVPVVMEKDKMFDMLADWANGRGSFPEIDKFDRELRKGIAYSSFDV